MPRKFLGVLVALILGAPFAAACGSGTGPGDVCSTAYSIKYQPGNGPSLEGNGALLLSVSSGKSGDTFYARPIRGKEDQVSLVEVKAGPSSGNLVTYWSDPANPVATVPVPAVQTGDVEGETQGDQNKVFFVCAQPA